MPNNDEKNRDMPETTLEEQASEAAPEEGDAGPSPEAAPDELPPLPAPTFSTFILSLASSALVHLGEVPEPSTGKQEENLPIAKHTIDILSMLEDKINNGLDEDEKRLLAGILYELRMKFVVKKQ